MMRKSLGQVGERLLRETPVLEFIRQHDPRGVEEILGIVERAADFARRHVEPVALELDAIMEKDPGYFDPELVRAAAGYRLFSMVVPTVLGGQAGRYMLTAAWLAIEEICSVCAGVGNLIAATGLGACPLLAPGGMPHWDTVLHELVEGEKKGEPVLMAYAITEPSAGTDVEEPHFLAKARIGMEARPVKGGYLLNGRKCFISGGKEAKYLTVCAATDRSRPLQTWTVFLVDRDMEGFSVPRVERKMGQRACHAAELLFENVFVPESHVLGYEGDGMTMGILNIMAASRGPVGAVGTGIARGVLRHFLSWARRKRGGRRPIEDQRVQMAVADMAASIQQCRGLVLDHGLAGDRVFGKLLVNPAMKALFALPREWRLSSTYQSFLQSPRGKAVSARLMRLLVSDEDMTRLLGMASLAKFAATDMAMSVASRALELMGPEDCEERRWLEKCYRDVKVTQIYEGTNQLNRLTWYMVEQEGSLRIELPRPRG